MSDLLGGVPVTARSGRCAMSIGGSQQIAANRSLQANCQRPIECTLGIDVTQCDAFYMSLRVPVKKFLTSENTKMSPQFTQPKISTTDRTHARSLTHSRPAAGHSTFFL